MPLKDTASDWLALDRPAVLVEVTRAQGSVPRDAGTRMLVAEHEVAGTIGGGHLELKAIERARQMLAAIDTSVHTQHVPLGPALGQCCGGTVDLRFERLRSGHVIDWPKASPMFHLQLFGAGHVGRAVARLLAALNVQVDWIDEREDEFPPSLATEGAWPPHIRKLAIDAVEAEVSQAPPGAFYLVMTHQHDLDQRITEAILRRGDFGFLGLIGSKTKRQRFVHRFEQKGFDAALIDRLACPIGIDGIEGKEPEVIAVAVVAQLLRHAAADPNGAS
jgi:xanthine dehydrogenase accessory factor